MIILSRRKFLSYTSLTLCAGILGLPKISLASAPTDKRFVFIFLRGAMDGLFSVPAYGDPDYISARNGLAVPAPGQENGALKLDGMFGLHPSLTNLHGLYGSGQLNVFHAIASPYRERSHFDAQDLLENGSAKPHFRNSGWLNAAIASMNNNGQPLGIAIGTNIPLSLLGAARVSSWAPSVLPDANPDTIERLKFMYSNDPQLKNILENAQAAQDQLMDEHNNDSQESMAGNDTKNKMGRQAFNAYMKAAGQFLSDENGPRVATVDLSGFDSHNNQAGDHSLLVRTLSMLDGGIATLKDQLGPVWNKTTVLIVTEFGRTVAMNGTKGSDHGTGTAAFLTGGAVKGGKVYADWPGLSKSKLYQDRDLYPTSDIRSLEMAVLRDHLGISEAAIHRDIFPDSASVKPFSLTFA